jgi:hypothetical protein
MAEQEKEFRGVVVSLSEALKEKETNILVYTHCLPMEYNDKKPLTVLQLMHNRDLFSATNPDRLATLMKEINRIDLAKIVEKYTRKTRKGAKSRTQLDSATAAADVDSSLFVSLQAKLEVTSIQSDITAKALEETLKTVKATPFKRVEEIVQDAKVLSDKLRNLVLRAQHLYHLSRPTPQLKDARPELPLPTLHKQGSDDDIYCNPHDDDSDIYNYPHFDGVESRSSTNTPSDSEYETMSAESMQKTTLQPESAAQMVTGLSGRGIKPEKPAIRPKPTKTRSEGNSSGLITTPPVIGANEIQKRKSTLKRAGTTKPLSDQLPPESRSTNSSVDTADYTGGSCTGGEGTGEYTGDSGFGDATPFLKVDIAGSQPTARPTGARPLSASGSGYYKTMGTPDSVEGYITVTRDSNTDQADDWYRPTDVKHMNDDEVEYMYVKMH